MENGGLIFNLFDIAYELKRNIEEIETMSIEEYNYWCAYISKRRKVMSGEEN